MNGFTETQRSTTTSHCGSIRLTRVAMPEFSLWYFLDVVFPSSESRTDVSGVRNLCREKQYSCLLPPTAPQMYSGTVVTYLAPHVTMCTQPHTEWDTCSCYKYIIESIVNAVATAYVLSNNPQHFSLVYQVSLPDPGERDNTQSCQVSHSNGRPLSLKLISSSSPTHGME